MTKLYPNLVYIGLAVRADGKREIVSLKADHAEIRGELEQLL